MRVAEAKDTTGGPRFGGRDLAIVFAAFAALALAIYAPSLRGEFLSDDVGYIVTNPWVRGLAFERPESLFDPFGEAAAYTANWAPVHLFVHALEWRLFGAETLGWRVVNVILHAGVATLLVPVFLRAGVAAVAAVLGALLFLVHPANVEVVAWITQLKTILCLAFGVGALLAHPRRPVLAAALFALGLLSKTTALFALPVAFYGAYRSSKVPGAPPARFGWLALWALALVAYSLPQLLAFERLGEAQTAGAAMAPLELLRTMVAIAARYLAMAATSFGVAAFQQPAPARSWLDPWWLVGLAVGLPLAWRAAQSLATGRAEGGFWLWATAAYAPVSQIFPFLYPVADRYLYVVLPGLLGVVLLAAGDGVTAPPRSTLRRVGAAAAVCLVAFFAVRTFERAAVFRSNASLMLDAARAHPEGISGSLLAARRAAQDEDVAGVVAAIRRAADAGFDSFIQLDEDPGLAPVRGDPRFRGLVREIAGRWIALATARGYSTQLELRALARAHAVREEWKEAVAALERAAAAGGPADAVIAADLAEARRALARAGGGTGGAAPR